MAARPNKIADRAAEVKDDTPLTGTQAAEPCASAQLTALLVPPRTCDSRLAIWAVAILLLVAWVAETLQSLGTGDIVESLEAI